MDPKINKFLTALELHLAIEAVGFTIAHYHELNLDLGLGSVFINQSILVVLGKLQKALIEAQVAKGFAPNESDSSVQLEEPPKIGWN